MCVHIRAVVFWISGLILAVSPVFLHLSSSLRTFRQEGSAGIYGLCSSNLQCSDSFSCAANTSSHVLREKEPSHDDGTLNKQVTKK